MALAGAQRAWRNGRIEISGSKVISEAGRLTGPGFRNSGKISADS